MKVNVTETLKNFKNEDIRDGNETLTYRNVFYVALNQFLPEEKPSGELKAKCFGIMQKFFLEDDVNLTSDEAALIKERVGKIYSPLVYGRVCELLDGPLEEEKDDKH